MQILHEINNIQYQIFDISMIAGTAKVVAEAFCSGEPMTVCQNISVQNFVHFVKLFGSKTEQEGLTIVAIDKTTSQIVGAVVTDDFGLEPPDGLETISEKFVPVFTLLGELDDQYKENKTINPGEYLHIFMVAVDNQYKNKHIAYNLVQTCLENGIKKGYKIALAEVTGSISQDIFKNKCCFVDRFKINYKIFTYNGKQVFETIKGHIGTILVDKQVA